MWTTDCPLLSESNRSSGPNAGDTTDLGLLRCSADADREDQHFTWSDGSCPPQKLGLSASLRFGNICLQPPRLSQTKMRLFVFLSFSPLPHIMNSTWSFLILNICAFKQQPPLPTKSSNRTKMDLNGEEGGGSLCPLTRSTHCLYLSPCIFIRLYGGASSLRIHIFGFYQLKTFHRH